MTYSTLAWKAEHHVLTISSRRWKSHTGNELNLKPYLCFFWVNVLMVKMIALLSTSALGTVLPYLKVVSITNVISIATLPKHGLKIWAIMSLESVAFFFQLLLDSHFLRHWLPPSDGPTFYL